MCDYSLMGIRSRLAVEGEELVTFRFSMGSVGLAPWSQGIEQIHTKACSQRCFWGALRKIFLDPIRDSIPAVCVPPGARLLLIAVQQAIQQRAGVGAVEEITFTQLTAAENQYRDAVRFPNGVEILLQDFANGQRVRVLDLSWAEPRHPEIAEESSFTLVP
jgi:hypothetical protein